ncbi:hypothetical protein O181_012053 [Austropuccinia psidii MF-1]|uniref:Uncharacterized protein n=1 Tax=Austropuccinia psidii MF-1 TaxID=1389203 RepID=A0A9Q3BW20_9BASI|nr:hypothetical protein [Austropuccinia psidii MF-1]
MPRISISKIFKVPSKIPITSTTRPQTRSFPISNPTSLQPVASTSSKNKIEILPLPFPDSKVFQRGKNWPIRATRYVGNSQDSISRIFGEVDINSRGDNVFQL